MPRASLLLLLCLAGGALPAHAQPSATERSYRAAREILDRGVAAVGGIDRLRAMPGVEVEIRGPRTLLYQDVSATAPEGTTRAETTLRVDLRGNRISSQTTSRNPVGFEFTFRRVTTPAGGFNADLRGNAAGKLARRTEPSELPAQRSAAAREILPLLLLDAVNQARTLRVAGVPPAAGARHDAITFTQGDGTPVTLFFDRATGLPAAFELFRSDPMEGDQTVRVEFGGYTGVEGLRVPTTRTEHRGARVFRRDTLTTRIAGAMADSLFALPAGYTVASGPDFAPDAVQRLGDGVYLFPNVPGGGVMAVEFSDFVVVVEAPLSSGVGETVIALVRRTIPTKPIRFVAFSHHHNDHGGGLRPYIARGVTVLTTPENRGFVEGLARARFTLAPDSLARAPRPLALETFAKKRVITDGRRTLELHDIGPLSHAREMVIAYIPELKLVFQGDLLIMPDDGTPAEPMGLHREFAGALRGLGLDVEVIAGAHGRTGTIADLQRAAGR